MQRPSPRFRSEKYLVYEISEEMFTQIYRDLYGDAMLVPTWMGTNIADGTNKNICYRVLVQKRKVV